MSEDKKPNNPNAFPEIEQGYDMVGCPVERLHSGMTLRDYFAAKAMGGYISTYDTGTGTLEVEEAAEYISEMCYKVADAMLKQRGL